MWIEDGCVVSWRLSPVTSEQQTRPLEIAAMAMHRWKHPTYRLGDFGCHCRDDATLARSLLDEADVRVIRDDPEATR